MCVPCPFFRNQAFGFKIFATFATAAKVAFLSLIQLHKLPRVADHFEVAQKLRLRDYHRATAVVGVETQTLGTLQVLVEEEVRVILRVVDKAEGRYRAGFQAEVSLHTLWRGETQLALMQSMFEVVNRHILVAIEADQIVSVALVVAKKEVFAVHRAVVAPILLCNLDGWRLGVKIDLVFNIVRLQKVENPLAAQF